MTLSVVNASADQTLDQTTDTLVIWSVCNKLGAETRAQAVSLFVRSGKPSQLEDAE